MQAPEGTHMREIKLKLLVMLHANLKGTVKGAHTRGTANDARQKYKCWGVQALTLGSGAAGE